jgi:hypothetical protein
VLGMHDRFLSQRSTFANEQAAEGFQLSQIPRLLLGDASDETLNFRHASKLSWRCITGTTISTGGGLNQPLGLAIAPNHDILTVNGGDGNLIETTPAGMQFAPEPIDTSGAGAGTLFGLAVRPNGKGIYFVDDGDNTLDLLH